MQQYADIYLLQSHSTCFGCPSHPSSGVLKAVTATAGTGHNTGTATSLQRCLQAVIKIQPDATVCRYLFTAKSLYMFRVSIAPIIKSTKSCNCSLRYGSYYLGSKLLPTWRWKKLATQIARSVPVLVGFHQHRITMHWTTNRKCVCLFV